MKRRILNIIILVFGLYLIISLTKDIVRLLNSGGQVGEAEERLERMVEEERRLLVLKEEWSSEAFVEEEARNKLNMGRPGETVVILPGGEGGGANRSETTDVESKPNWKKWVELFW